MTIQQLRYFLALCQDLNYTRTAGRLYLSRQALRLSIAALEEELCGPLFINVRNHLALTEKGQRFRAQAAPVVEQFDRMCAQAYQDIRSPALRLGISVALVPSYLPMLGMCWSSSGSNTRASRWKPHCSPTTPYVHNCRTARWTPGW